MDTSCSKTHVLAKLHHVEAAKEISLVLELIISTEKSVKQDDKMLSFYSIHSKLQDENMHTTILAHHY